MSDRDLPMSTGNGGADRAPEGHQPPAWRLVGTLGVAAVAAGFAIVFVYQWAHPRIEAHQAEQLRAAVHQVLGGPDTYRPVYVLDGQLLDSLPPGADSTDARTVYAGFDGDRLIGFAVPGEKPGYQDVVRLIFGYDPREDLVLGMTVLESKETPGLGAKITSDSAFISQFGGIRLPLEGVKDGAEDPGEVDMITGATISSEVVIEIINEGVGDLGPFLREGMQNLAPPAAGPSRGDESSAGASRNEGSAAGSDRQASNGGPGESR